MKYKKIKDKEMCRWYDEMTYTEEKKDMLFLETLKEKYKVVADEFEFNGDGETISRVGGLGQG